MAVVIEPIMPEVGKKYYVKISGILQEDNPHALIKATVEAIGQLTISLEWRNDSKRITNTYHKAHVGFIEEIAAQSEKV